MHPFDTYSRVNCENIKHGIKSRYIFTSKYAINQAVKAIDYADLIVVLSNESKESFVRNGVDEKKIKVVNLGLTQKYENRYSIDKEFAFVSTAKHSLVKGSHNLLLAWRDANVNNMKLYMVGPISRELNLFIEKHGPFNNVVFSGPKNVHDFYINYNFIGVLNSLSEGYGRSVIEYMGYGFPVITTPVATCDIVEHGREGLIVDGHQELVMALRYFSENLEQYEVMGTFSRFSAEKTLKDNYVDKMIEIFKSV
nr:glycosyltransferase family 4 protein [Vibrio cincinnatiensis]